MNTTPAIESVRVHEQIVTLWADITLASIPFTLTGQYNITNNVFHPKLLMPAMDIKDGNKVLVATGLSSGIEEVCKALGWDYSETHTIIQEAIEKRDQ